MERRRFMTMLAGGMLSAPLAVEAQKADGLPRIGVFLSTAANDPESLARVGAFLQGMQELGWTDGRNVRIEYRWGSGDAGLIRKYAAELVALAPEVILAQGSSTVGPLQLATRDVPIVFVIVPDPVGAGFVDSLAR